MANTDKVIKMSNRFLMQIIISAFFVLIPNTTAFIKGNSTDDQKYKVIRTIPENSRQLAILSQLLYESTESQLNFWRSPTDIEQPADIMLKSSIISSLSDLLMKYNMTFKVIIDDVEKLMYEREGRPRNGNLQNNSTTNNSIMDLFSKRWKDVTSSKNRAKYRFGDYHSYDIIISWLNDIESLYPNMAKVFTIGQTFEGRKINGIKIGNPIDKTDKRIIWIDGGIHAREWASIHTVLYIIDQLISKYGTDPQITSYVDMLNFYFVPVVNPDGYEYSRSDQIPQARFWRKNRGKITCFKDQWYRQRCCTGVDLNRNFDFYWGEIGSSSQICSEIYHGSKPFSEPETRAIRDKLLSAEMFGKVDAFITLHTYSQMWIHPYSHQRRSFPNDVNDLEEVGKQAVKALEDVYGTKFRFGSGADILYPSSGGSDDWAKSKAGVKFVYLLELRPGENDYDGFLLDRRQLIPTGRETWAGIRVVINAIIRSQRAVAPGIPINSITNRSRSNLRFTTSRFPSRQPFKTTTTKAPLLKSSTVTTIRPKPKTMMASRTDYRLENLRRRERFIRHKFRRFQKEFCADTSSWCAHWIDISPNICQTAATYMRQKCALSCRLC
uniref:ShKT domain-containing protein n=2 Tax=Onchocerca TaxID=6281 RepID=A0A8R1TLJ8_ONCVO